VVAQLMALLTALLTERGEGMLVGPGKGMSFDTGGLFAAPR
jgi:hypothetical protein